MPVVIYISAKDKEQALAIGRVLVAERLAACANVLDGMTSVYWWQGKVEEASETVLIVKTKESLAGAVADRVKEMHSYDCPAIVALPIVAGSAEYLAWIEQETR